VAEADFVCAADAFDFLESAPALPRPLEAVFPLLVLLSGMARSSALLRGCSPNAPSLMRFNLSCTCGVVVVLRRLIASGESLLVWFARRLMPVPPRAPPAPRQVRYYRSVQVQFPYQATGRQLLPLPVIPVAPRGGSRGRSAKTTPFSGPGRGQAAQRLLIC